MKESEATARR